MRTMSREEAIKLASYFAYGARKEHSYCPQAKDLNEYGHVEGWMPHEWVIQAIIEASRPEHD